uniref:G_PROTEIN_RECEP_F1_2 domain-containing protein n=1 Tax=Steinernema glaseri TaxID=37863 RepID=A0A1I7YVC8_9BILA
MYGEEEVGMMVFLSCSPAMASNNTVTALPGVRIFGASSYATLCSFGLFSNIVLLVVFIKGRSEYRKVPFFVIACQLIVCDIVTNLVQFAVAVPITYTGRA